MVPLDPGDGWGWGGRDSETLPGICRRRWSWIRTAPCWRTRKCGWRTGSPSSEYPSSQAWFLGPNTCLGPSSGCWLPLSGPAPGANCVPRAKGPPPSHPTPQFRLRPLLDLSLVAWGRGGARSPPFRSARVPCRVELVALERVVRISAKPTKRLQEALQPILAKHGLSPQQVALCLVSRGTAGQRRGGWERAACLAGC